MSIAGRISALPLLLLLFAEPVLANADQAERGTCRGPYFAQAELAFQFFRHLDETKNLFTTTGMGLRGGYRWDRWALLGQIERNGWITLERDSEVLYSTLNLGAGTSYCFFECRARTSLVGGMTVLLMNTDNDEPGTVGIFLDFRPAAYRWPLWQQLSLVVDPLSFVFLMPVLDRIPLIVFEFRTTACLEYRF